MSRHAFSSLLPLLAAGASLLGTTTALAQTDEERLAIERRARDLAQEADELTAATRFDEALAKCDEVLRLESYWYTPYVLVTKASIGRYRGNPGPGLNLIQTAEGMVAKFPDNATARHVRWFLLIEKFHTCIGLGVLDLAEGALRDCRALPWPKSALERLAVAVAEVNLHLARHELDEVVACVDAVLADADLVAASPGYIVSLTVKRLCARYRQTTEHDELVRIATELERHARPSGAVDAVLAAGACREAIQCWLAAGEHARARRLVEQFADSPGPDSLIRAEIAALYARGALAEAAADDVLRARRQELEREFEGVLAGWRQSPLRAGGQSPFHFRHQQEIVLTLLELDMRLCPPDRVAEVLFARIEAALSLGNVTRRLAAPPPTLAELQHELAAGGGGVLVHFTARRGGHVLAIDGTSVQHVVLTHDAAFWREANHYLRAIARQPEADAAVDRLRASGSRLAERMLGADVTARIAGWRRVVVVAEGPDASLLQALPWRDSWLCLEKPLLQAPSATLALALHRREQARVAAPSQNRGVVIVADPTIAPATAARWNVAPLGLTAAVRRSLVAACPAPRARAFWDAAAAWDAFAGAVDACALCVLTHGVQDYDRERSAGLVLAAADGQEPVVFAEQIETLRAPPLVVLAACEAATGPARFGDDEAGHLGGAFLTAGASAVVSARGMLSLGATTDLLRVALGQWRGDVGFAEALRRGRRAVQADPDRAHPYYWAGLRLIGADIAPPPP